MTTDSTISRLSAALELAAAGFRVFPIRGDSKVPLVKWRHGDRPATTNTAQVTAWWERWPKANIGIATGDGLAVVDTDPRNGAENDIGALGLPDTLSAVTAGGGRHYYYRVDGPLKGRAHAFGPGLDLKADGGMVVAPGSSILGRPYSWKLPLVPMAEVASDDLRALLVEVQRAARGEYNGNGWEPLDIIPEGQRHDELCRWAGYAASQGADEDDLTTLLLRVNRERCVPPGDEEHIIDIAQWAARLPA